MDQIIIGDQYIKVYFCQQVDVDLDLSREQAAILCCLDIVEFPRQGNLLEKSVTVYRRYGISDPGLPHCISSVVAPQRRLRNLASPSKCESFMNLELLRKFPVLK
jgi:hypothetical protein